MIGEAAGKVSVEGRAEIPAVRWRAIIGMRNRLVHVYFDIDYDQVWKALTEDMPSLIEGLEFILDKELPDKR